jgi:DNA-directed RNA polymerase subunit beta'
MTCESEQGVCQMCYGMDLSTGNIVEMGLAVGIIAAQSIGEPGTQLTMRTFHYGGTASRSVEESEVRARKAGTVKYHEVSVVENEEGERVLLKRAGDIRIVDAKDRELDRYSLAGGETGVEVGALVRVKDGQKVREGQILIKWDPHVIPILADIGGRVRFEDMVDEVTVREEVDSQTGVRRKVIMEHKGDLHPQVVIEDNSGKILGLYPIPEKAHLEVTEGQVVKAGIALAKTPKQISGSQDITGGLPRVTELFEARKPKDPAIISEIDGVVELGDKKRGKRTIIVKNESGMMKEHVVPLGKHVKVHRGDRVRAGDALVDGHIVPHDRLRINGVESVQGYLLEEIQNVYRAQNVGINDKHVEIIIAQMLRRVHVENPGDTDYLPGSVVDRLRFGARNEAMKGEGKKPATASPVLLGITRAALQSESFLAAASFQETTRVLTEAALGGKTDELRGLKANVILGHLIPAGTGFGGYLEMGVDVKQVDAAMAGLLTEGELDGEIPEGEAVLEEGIVEESEE